MQENNMYNSTENPVKIHDLCSKSVFVNKNDDNTALYLADL